MNKKKYIPYIIIVIVLLISYILIRPSISFVKDKNILEKGNQYQALDFIASSNCEVIPEEEYLNTDEVGEFSFTYEVKRWFLKRNVKYKYEVVDTTPPQITIKENKVIKYLNDKYDEEEMAFNISVDEGNLVFESNYDPNTLGEYYVNVEAIDDYGNKSNATYEVLVTEDAIAPFVFRNGNGATLIRGSKFDINEIISYGDNLDPNPTITVNGNVNTLRVGSYPMHVILEDYSLNKTEWHFIVHVVDSITPHERDNSYYTFEDFKNDHKGEGLKYGIDVSSWQGDIDYQKVKNAGCEFVIMRIGFSYEGKLTIDKKFNENIKNAKEAGLPVGVYLFCYDNNEEDLLSSIDQMYEAIGDYKLDLPVIFDWEDFGSYQSYKMSFKDLNHLYDVFEREVNNRGDECMLYGSKYYLNTVWGKLDSRPIWLAQYASKPSFDYDFKIWQVSDRGKIDGISELADFNIMYP